MPYAYSKRPRNIALTTALLILYSSFNNSIPYYKTSIPLPSPASLYMTVLLTVYFKSLWLILETKSKLASLCLKHTKISLPDAL